MKIQQSITKCTAHTDQKQPFTTARIAARFRDDNQKNANLKHGRWVATAEFRGIAGYYINELYATFYGFTL